ncbi:unnamed protein product [Phaeothamnion confervicola]
MAGRSARRSGAGDRIAAMVDEKLAQGLEYEALQLYRGQAARRAARGNFGEAAGIAEAGAAELMNRGYVDAGTELAIQMVDVLCANHVPPTDESRDRVRRINELYAAASERQAASTGDAGGTTAADTRCATKGKEDGAGQGLAAAAVALGTAALPDTPAAISSPAPAAAAAAATAAPAIATSSDAAAGPGAKLPVAQLQVRFLKAASKWGHAEGEWVHGDPELAALLGRALMAQKELDLAVKYLVIGERPEEAVDGIWTALPGRGQARAARERQATRAILHFLMLGNMRDANKTLDRVRQRLGKDSEPPLIVFCGMLLLTCERSAAPVFPKLLEMFVGNLSTDPRLNTYLGSIGQRYFDIQPPKTMMDSIMAMVSPAA